MIQPGQTYTIKTSDTTLFAGMRKTRFTGHDPSLFFHNAEGQIVPATAIIWMQERAINRLTR